MILFESNCMLSNHLQQPFSLSSRPCCGIVEELSCCSCLLNTEQAVSKAVPILPFGKGQSLMTGHAIWLDVPKNGNVSGPKAIWFEITHGSGTKKGAKPLNPWVSPRHLGWRVWHLLYVWGFKAQSWPTNYFPPMWESTKSCPAVHAFWTRSRQSQKLFPSCLSERDSL